MGQRVSLPGITPSGNSSTLNKTSIHPSTCYCFICYQSKRKSKGKVVATKVHEDVQQGDFSVCGERLIPISSVEDVVDLARLIDLQRTTVSHELNAISSRSHCIITIHVGHKKFLLVDLAGSERIEKSQVTGVAQKQAVAINSSLSALDRVITAIGKGSNHIPFRDSTLTKILSSSLKGRSKMAAIVCISAQHIEETICSLRFGERMAAARPMEATAVVQESQIHPNSCVDIDAQKNRLAHLKEAVLEIETQAKKTKIGVNVTMFLDSQRLLQKLVIIKGGANLLKEVELLELRIKQKENPTRFSLSDINSLIQRRNNVRDVVARQSTIKGLREELMMMTPAKDLDKMHAEISNLEKQISMSTKSSVTCTVLSGYRAGG
jgi:hypothetical protein